MCIVQSALVVLRLFEKLPSWLTDLSKAVTWPIVALIIFSFSRHKLFDVVETIKNQLPRISGQIGGLKVDPIQSKQQESVEGEPSSSDESLYDPRIFGVFASVEEMEPVVKNFRHQLDTNQDVKPKNKLTHVLYYAATLLIQLQNERNYRIIFGSQIKLLKKLNDNSITTVSQARLIYDAAKPSSPDFYNSYPFEAWVGFLSAPVRQLCLVNGEAINITAYGKGFLDYLVKEGLNEDRLF